MTSEKSEISNVNNNIVNNYCKYLNKKVLLKTIKSSHYGSLKCIDPLTQTVALISHDNQSNLSKVVLVMSHSIKSIQLYDDHNKHHNNNEFDINLKQFLSTSMGEELDKTFSDQELNERKLEVIKWLKENHIPVEESDDGSLIIAFAVTLSQPYTKDQCICNNEIVLGKIQALIDSMPENK